MSRVEIFATNTAGEMFAGVGEIKWSPTRPEYADNSFKPNAIHQFLIHGSDGSTLGWTEMWKPRAGESDDEAETEG